MRCKSIHQFFLLMIISFLSGTLLSAGPSHANTEKITIGILAPFGMEATREMWQPTADYLEDFLPGKTIEIIPLRLQDTDRVVKNRLVDLILTNPGNYIELESKYGASRILTMQRAWEGKSYRRFGAVIFTRSDNGNIQGLSDLKDHSFMGVSEKAFGGFQMAWELLKEHGMDPFNDFSQLKFSGFPQQDIVRAVRDGLVDAGTVRTGVLELMADAGEIELSQFRVLNQQHMEDHGDSHEGDYFLTEHLEQMQGFPFLHSTRLYPEWPLAKLRHMPAYHTEELAIALLNLPVDSPAAISAGVSAWTVPLDYTPVHDLLKKLEIGPYQYKIGMLLEKIIRNYWYVLLVAWLLLVLFLMRFWWVERAARIRAMKLVEKSRELEDRESRLTSILENTADGIITIDENGLIESFNRAAERIFGYHAGWIIGRSINVLLPEDYVHKHDGFIRRQIESGENKFIGMGAREVEARHFDGSRVYIDLAISEVLIEGRRLFIGLARDINDRIQARNEKEKLNRDKQLILESADEGIYGVDREGQCIFINQAGARMLGYSPEELVGRYILPQARDGIADRDSFRAHESSLAKVIVSGEGNRVEKEQFWRRDGRQFYASYSCFPIEDEGSIKGAVVTFSDISDRILAEERLSYLANYDALTGLPNRNLFNERLTAIKTSTTQKRLIGILVLDLDNIKSINDTLGHKYGDLLIQAIGKRLDSMAGQEDCIARFGGDEFIIMRLVNDQNELIDDVKAVLNQIQEPLFIEDYELIITTSIGVCVGPVANFDGDEMIRHADAAMYRAKESGRNSYVLFSDDLDERSKDMLALEHSLRYALERQEFCVWYQPQVECSSSRVIGLEALIRWQHPSQGLVRPDSFIPLLETTGLIQPVGEYVLRTACEQLVEWQAQGFHGLRIAVNVSSRQFYSEDFLDILKSVLRDTEISPDSLHLELTEGVLMEHAKQNIAVMHAIKDLGVKISVDDFGTGYSSLAYLKRFPIDILKIDRAFVCDLEKDSESEMLVKAIIDLAHNLEMEVVAEGTESEGQIGLLESHGCKVFQGYYFSKPLPASEIDDYLRRTISVPKEVNVNG